ncbi:MAG: hypothetical protein WBE83_02995 [Candidatus Cybelea sp.]
MHDDQLVAHAFVLRVGRLGRVGMPPAQLYEADKKRTRSFAVAACIVAFEH